MVGGESAGGELCAALCMLASGTPEKIISAGKLIFIKMQKSLYLPMQLPQERQIIPIFHRHIHLWETGEPFYRETLTYIENLKKAGIPAEVDVYHCDLHAFDMLKPESKLAKKAAAVFNRHFEYAREHYFAEQKK